MVMRTPVAPGLSGALRPNRSPGCGNALPLLEIRASTMTLGAAESLTPGAMLMLSSSEKSRGSSLAGMRSTASGIRCPSAARAKMKTVSLSATLDASAAFKSTRPEIAEPAVPVPPPRGADGADGALGGGTGTALPFTLGSVDFGDDIGDLTRFVRSGRQLGGKPSPVPDRSI